MLMVGIICLLIGSWIGTSLMSIFAVSAYEKGYQDALRESVE